MNVLNRISKKDIRDLLGKGWLTHDGMWFYHAYQALGIETANELNKAAIQSLAPVEVKRVKRALGIKEKDIVSFDDLVVFMHDALEITLPESVFDKLKFSSPRPNTLHWEWKNGECFAYQGMQVIGIIDEYRCGVMYRIECWLEALGLEFSMNPKIDKCMMHAKGTCAGDISVTVVNS
jgi:hypothetical protein